MIRKKCLLFLTCLYFLFAIKSLANNYPPISYLGIENGLSNSTVNSIYKDHKGFMWFGTSDGLNRFDGYDFKVFRNRLSDTTTITSNFIHTIGEDANGNIWVGTREGASILNGVSNKFSSLYYQNNKTQQIQRVAKDVRVIVADKKGNMYISTLGLGLLVSKMGSNIAEQAPLLLAGTKTIEYNAGSINVADDGTIWLFIEKVGLCKLDREKGVLELINNTLKYSGSIIMDGNSIWVASWDGLYKYNIRNNVYEQKIVKWTEGHVSDMCLDKKKNDLWIASYAGLKIVHLQTGTVDYLRNGNDNHSISSLSVRSIYQDEGSRIWMGTLRGGIDIIDDKKDKFKTIENNPSTSNTISSNLIFSFAEIKKNQLWIGTDGGGLNIWDRDKNHFANYVHDNNNPASIGCNYISNIKKDYLGNVWIATYGGGIDRFNSSANSFQHYPCINPAGRQYTNTLLLYEDSKKDLWASAFSGGSLFKLNRKEDKFEVYETGLTDFLSILEDKNGMLWAGNADKLVQIDRKSNQHITYYIGKPIRCIYEDNSNDFWLGTEGGGLILFDRKSGNILARYTVENGLSNNCVLDMLEDDNGNLWLSTFDGLSRFNISTRKFKCYYKNDGLQSSEFNYNAAIKLSSGEMVFGGIKGFSIFNPKDIIGTNDNTSPPLVLTGMSINNIPFEEDYSTAPVRVSYDNAIFNFNYSALEYTSPNKISYAYTMEGWDKGWNYCGNIRTATYTHLTEGNYIFRIKSTDTDGNWNSKEIAIKIRVLPPWFRTWWAYLFYLSLILWLAYFYFNYRSHQTKLEYEVKISLLEAERKKAEYEKEVAEHEKDKERYEREKLLSEKDKEMNEKRISFFTNISHEFRTPLTLIINPIKELIEEQEYKKGAKGLNIVYRNAKRMLSLVDQLLLFRKAEADMDQMKVTKLNFTDLCNEVYLCFLQEADRKLIKYLFICTNPNIDIYGDKEKLEIILYNLISNAMKYTPERGKIVFEITETANTVEVTISDNGRGIPENIGTKLFDKFYQVTGAKAVLQPGFGIGLFLVKHFADAHKGTISYSSKPEDGTSFNLTLLKGIEHFGSEHTIYQSDETNSIFDELKQDNVNHLVNEQLNGNDDTQEKKTINETLITNKKTLLIVDDEQEIRKYIVSLFVNDYIIYEAESGEEGAILAQKHDPDLIISDIKMKGMSGIDFCKLIKENEDTSYIPVILLTGTSSPELKLQGAEHGADDYITKPFEKEFLIARVNNLIKNRSNLRNYFINEITFNKTDGKVSEEYKDFLDKCIAIVEKHLDDDQFSVKTLVSEIGMSRSNLLRKVKIVSGQSINVFIRFIRLRKAADMFINTNQNVNETALSVGMNDIKHFREQFHKLYGMNPSDYIKKYRKVLGNQYNKL